jgi:hypothetical protein
MEQLPFLELLLGPWRHGVFVILVCAPAQIRFLAAMPGKFRDLGRGGAK